MAWSDWVRGKAQDVRGVTAVQRVDHETLRIARAVGPNVVVFCPDLPRGATLAEEVAQSWLERTPDGDFAAFAPTWTAEGAYELLRSRNVAVGTFGDLSVALRSETSIHTYVPRLAGYIERRLRAHPQVECLQWNSHLTYRVLCRAGRGDLRVVFGEPYEVSADWVVEQVEAIPFPLNAVVTSNPNCRRIADAALRAGRNAGVRVLTMGEFLRALHEPWPAD